MGAIEAMKVCHLASGDLWAGAEVQLAMLLRGLVQYRNVELRAILFNSGILADRIADAGIPVEVIEESRHNSLSLMLKTKKILKRDKIEILHTHRYKENFLGGLASRGTSVKHIVRTVHGMGEPFRGFQNVKAQFYAYLDRMASERWVNKIVAVSNDINRSLAWLYGEEKMVTIHNGIEADRVPQRTDVASAKRKLGVEADTPVIGTVGRHMPVKGYDVLLRAFKLVNERKPEARLVLVGDGPERASLESLAAGLGIDSRVVFYGFTEDVAAAMSAFDVFVLSSIHEGISISLLEAFAMGIPVVVTDVGGNPEVVRHMETGLIVPPRDEGRLADALTELLDDKQLCGKMIKNQREVVTGEFSAETMAQRTEELYRELMAE